MTAAGAPADIAASFGVGDDNLIGEGGESRVYALSDQLILRVPRKAAGGVNRKRLKAFLDRLRDLPFATPEILEFGPEGEWTIERRLPGTSMLTLMRTLAGDARETALRNYAIAVDAFRAVSLLYLPYGHVLSPQPVRTADWHEFVERTLAGFLTRNRAAIAREVGDADALFGKAQAMIADLPRLPDKVLVHGDYFPGNVLLDDALRVSAVLDFSVFTVAGDPQLDLAVAYLTLELLEECTAEDAAFVRALIVERHGQEADAAFRFYRAYLAFSMADPANAAPPYPRLYDWSIAQLRLLAEDSLTA